MKQPDDPTRPHFYVAEIETVDGQSWLSLHITHDDAEAKLVEVGKGWGIEADLDIAQDVRSYSISHLPVHNIGEIR
jgi:hypothetical protein